MRVRVYTRGGGTGTHGDGSFARLRNFVTGEYLDSSRQVSILSLMKTRETFETSSLPKDNKVISRTSNLFSFDALLYIYIFFFHIVVSILEMFPQGRKKSHELVRDEIQEIKQIESSQAVSIQFQKLEILACHLARSCPPLYDRVTLSRSRKQFRR